MRPGLTLKRVARVMLLGALSQVRLSLFRVAPLMLSWGISDLYPQKLRAQVILRLAKFPVRSRQARVDQAILMSEIYQVSLSPVHRALEILKLVIY